MAKHKGRAARKQQREKAAKALDHGLPAPELAPRPQKTRKVGGDTVALAVASEKAGHAGPVRSATPPSATGMPVLAKVALGAGVVLSVVYGLSQLRKSDAPASASPAARFEETAPSIVESSPSAAEDRNGSAEEPSPAPVEEEVILEGAVSKEPSAERGEAPTASPPGRAKAPEPTSPAPVSQTSPAPARTVSQTATKAPTKAPTAPASPAPAAERAPASERAPAAERAPAVVQQAPAASAPTVGPEPPLAPVPAAPPKPE